MSIFQKDCPQCAAAQPIHASRCSCGYYFEPERIQSTRDAIELSLHQEQLYEDYLAARAVQLEAEAEVARMESAADPNHTYKAAQALRAEQTMRTVHAELTAQHDKISRLQDALSNLKAMAPDSVVAFSSDDSDAASAPIVTSSETSETNEARDVTTTVPTLAFRKLQERKAAATLKGAAQTETNAQSAGSSPPSYAAVTIVAPPVPIPSTQSCPNCSAAIPLANLSCACGFSFPTPNTGVPALSLDADALAILGPGLEFVRAH